MILTGMRSLIVNLGYFGNQKNRIIQFFYFKCTLFHSNLSLFFDFMFISKSLPSKFTDTSKKLLWPWMHEMPLQENICLVC